MPAPRHCETTESGHGGISSNRDLVACRLQVMPNGEDPVARNFPASTPGRRSRYIEPSCPGIFASIIYDILLIGIQAGGWLSKNYLSAPTQAPTRYAEEGNRVEVIFVDAPSSRVGVGRTIGLFVAVVEVVVVAFRRLRSPAAARSGLIFVAES
jgi:hypothetical protein